MLHAELSQVVRKEQSKNKMDLLQSGKSFKRWKMLLHFDQILQRKYILYVAAVVCEGLLPLLSFCYLFIIKSL